MIKFKEKSYSLVDNMIKGAIFGGAIAGGANNIVSGKLDSKIKSPLFREKRDKIWEDIDKVRNDKSDLFKKDSFDKSKLESLDKKEKKLHDKDSTYLAISGAIVGAALGALWTGAEWVTKKFNNRPVVNQCLDQAILNLKKMGFKENQDFTKNKIIADNMKTKITIAIIKSNGNLVVIVNSKNDPKLGKINKDIIRNLPTETISQKETDRFNEITITSMSSNNGDSVFISSIAEKFIKAGFSVYLMEVSN